MSPFLQFSALLVLLITSAKLAGYLSFRLGQPSVLGELLIGVILGPSLLNLLALPAFDDPHLGESIDHLSEIGVLLLMFIAGLDLHLEDLARASRVSALAGTLGVVFPFALGYGTGHLFQLGLQSSLYLGLILSATSVSISAQTLMELGVLRSRLGIGMLGAAVFDDVLVVLGLSIFVALAGEVAGLASVAGILLRMVLYLALGTLIGLWMLPRLAALAERMPISQGLVAFAFVIMLLYAWAAEVIGGMAAITGAFLAGLLLARSPLRDSIEGGASALAYGVFVPLFFTNVGLHANLRDLGGEAAGLAIVMIVAAIVSKVLGAGLGARLAGFDPHEALQLGVGMMSRGEVGLIVASLGAAEGLVAPGAFSAIVGMIIVTTLLTPSSLRFLITHGQRANAGPRTEEG
jgi:Kef-type K+ transport system membrane component KefB